MGNSAQRLKNLPFLKLLLPCVVGSLLGEYFHVDLPILVCIHFALAIIIFSASFFKITIKWRFIRWLSIIIFLHLITISWIHYTLNSFLKSTKPEIRGTILLKIDEQRKETDTGERYIATIYEKVRTGWIKRGKTNLYTKTGRRLPLVEGDVIITRKHPSIIKKNNNPGSFDNYTFSVTNGVFYSLTILDENMYFILGNYRGTIGEVVFQIRKRILGIIKRYITQQEELGIAEAMLIGYKTDLTSALNTTYSNAGVSHVIAISGMHLGLIYLIIHQMFAYFFSKKHLHFVAVILILPILWIFSMVTGSSASVVRSAIMYSFIIVGNLISKNGNSLNALLGAGFIMNVIYPDILNDLGFQLSFAAVLSIILYYQPIRNTVYTKNKLLQLGWSFVALSIAAQVITTPLLIYHFQKFSTYSLINNILIVPLSSTVLILEIILCLCPAPIISSKVLAPMIGMIIRWMNTYTSTMNKVPFSIIHFPTLEWYQILLYSMMLLGVVNFFMQNDKYNFIIIVLLSSFMICLLNIKNRYDLETKRQLIILNLKSEGSIIHQHGNNAIVYVYGNQQNGHLYAYSIIQKALHKLNVEKFSLRELPNKPLVIGRKLHKQALLINSDKLGRDLNKDLFSRNTCWIMDGSTKLWKIREWQKQAQNLHLRFLYTADAGPIFLDCQDFHEFSRKN